MRVRDATPNIQFTSCLGRENLQRTLPPIFDSRENSSGGPLSAPSTIRVRQADLASAALWRCPAEPYRKFTAPGTGYNPLPVRFRQSDLDRGALIAIRC